MCPFLAAHRGSRPGGGIEEPRLLNDLLALLERFDLPFDDRLAAKLRARIEDGPTAQLGEHDYEIADYGLEETEIQNAFSGYRKRFGV